MSTWLAAWHGDADCWPGAAPAGRVACPGLSGPCSASRQMAGVRRGRD